MSIDLYGHGPIQLPTTDTADYTDGPDRKHGPPRCRDVSPECLDAPTPHDHACCCDPCRHKSVNVCTTGNCCHCVPRKICAIFTPDEGEPADCTARSWTLRASEADERVNYSTTILGFGTLTVSVGRNSSETPGPCTWKIEVAEIEFSDEQAIDHSGAIHCQAPPDFAIESVNVPQYVDGAPVACYGTITLTSETMKKIPFVYQWKDITAEKFSRTCGSCTEFFSVICVRTGTAESAEYTRVNFTWDSGSSRYNASDGSDDYIELIEQDGDCYFKLSNITPISWTDDLILITPGKCAEELNLEATDEDGKWIKISGNPCHCWRYICGACRCVCADLCVVGTIANTLFGPTMISWDKDNLRWGDETFSITPYQDENGDCKATVTGFEDPASLVNTCGDNFIIQAATTQEEWEESGEVNYLTAGCKNCDLSCNQGTCLSACDDVPKLLYAEVSPMAWDEMLGCPVELCFETITIALVQSYVSTVENPAGEYRWQGCGVISCRSCNSATRTNEVICIDIGCDGLGTVSGPCGDSISFSLPCGSGDVWDLDFDLPCTGGGGCCDEAGFHITITE